MRVIVAPSAGFCRGVARAVAHARELAREEQGPVYTDGPLVHNTQVTESLAADGVRICEDVARLTSGVLLVRAHGISPERRERLEALPIRLVDATCPDVATIQISIQVQVREGRHVIIHGDPGHAEVVGLLGFAEGKGHVVRGADEVTQLPAVLGRVCLVAQSTQCPVSFEAVAQRVLGRYADTVVIDTICEATRRRQSDVRSMAAEVEAFVVVGGRHSANTRRLLAVARQTGRPAQQVETALDIVWSGLERVSCVGVTAGASTAPEAIADVCRALEDH